MKWMLMALVALAGCARSNGDAHDRDMSVAGADPGDGTGNVGGNGAGDMANGGGATGDLAMPTPSDMSTPTDFATPSDFATPPDLATPPDFATPPDMTPTSTDVYVHVMIDNFCNSSTNPTVINAPLHVPLNLTFHNDSVDYDADVWSSSNYGAYPLEIGGTWHDQVHHCLNPVPYTEYFDVGIHGGPVGGSCPNYRLYIHCN